MYREGETWEFRGEKGTFMMKFLQTDNPEYYVCEVMGGTLIGDDEIGLVKQVYKDSQVMKKYRATKVDGTNYQGNISKRRRTKEEIAFDNFIKDCLNKREIEKLKEQIDGCLITGDKELFMKLTKQLNKLREKVSV